MTRPHDIFAGAGLSRLAAVAAYGFGAYPEISRDVSDRWSRLPVDCNRE